MVSLEVFPQDCLVDEKISIKVSGVGDQPVRIEATITDEKGYLWASWAHFQPQQGFVNLSTQAPLCGTYSGIETMGLFYSLFPAPGARFPNRLMPRDVSAPQITKICVFPVPKNCKAKKGTKSIVVEEKEIKVLQTCCSECTDFPQTTKTTPLCEAIVKRRYMGLGVERKEIEHNGIVGSLFIPSKEWGKKSFPAVVDMFGSVGGLVEHRSALFASKGIVSLALPFFNYKTLPKNTKKLDLVYFEKAVRFLLSLPMVEKVGAIGVSQGGSYVLAMAAELPKGLLSGAISISPPARFFDPLIYHGKVLLEGIPLARSIPNAIFMDMGDSSAVLSDKMFSFQLEMDPINLEKSECPILFITGEDDKNVPAPGLVKHMISYAQAERKKNGTPERNNFRHISFEKCGHLIEPPYSPHCYCSWHGTVGAVFIWGGEVDGHSAAQEIAWEETIKFIHQNMTNSTSAKL